MKYSFQNMFGRLFLPVVVCRNTADWPVVYMNTRAGLALYPSYSVDQIKGELLSFGTLANLLRFDTYEEYTALRQMASNLGYVDDYRCEFTTLDGRRLSVSISGVSVSCDEANDYFVFYIVSDQLSEHNKYGSQLSSIINAAFLAEDVDASINMILALSGKAMNVCRVYIFEEISHTTTRNTYEWCAPGVVPAIQDLQNLEKKDYIYDVIISSGLFITDDVSDLPDESGREILEMQGIRALAIVTMFDKGKALGYVGYDDCKTTRQWGHDEVQFLKSISGLITVLMIRRNAERSTESAQNVLQLISDNSEEIIYANSLDDYSLLFVNKGLADILGKAPEELIGQPCYKVLQIGKDGPCDFCPIPKIPGGGEEDRSPVYTWEHFNAIAKKTYLAKDNIVKWPDGRLAHVETAVDISQRIEYETQLRFFASTDSMTGISNREWGAHILTDKLARGVGGSLCFIDIDGLKVTNDTHGHAVGDELIKEAVRIVSSRLSSNDFICRWGGDEFLIWFDMSASEADGVVGVIQEDMRDYNERFDKLFKLAFSYGIEPFGGEGATLDAIVTAADQSMYRNKMEKRNKSLKRRRTDYYCGD